MNMFFRNPRNLIAAPLFILSIPGAEAGLLVGPASATVNPGETADFWTLSNAATLQVNPGGQTLQLLATSSSINLQGATVTSTNSTALEISGTGATASISNSTLTSTGSTGITVGREAVVTLGDGVVNALGRGLNLNAGGQLTVTHSQVNAAGDGSTTPFSSGVGVAMVSGTATLTQGSTVTGANQGALMTADILSTGEPGRLATLVVDDSKLRGQTGSGILVTQSRPNRLPIADITLRNGAQLISGNGLALEITGNSTVTLDADHSTLVGGISAGTGSTLTATLQNGSSMSGDVTATGATADLSLLSASSLTGQISGTRQLNLSGGSVWNMTQSSRPGSLAIDNSRVNLGGSAGAYHVLTLDNLSGAGTFALNTDIGSHQGDQLMVTGSASGNHTLEVINSGLEPKAGNSGLVLASIASGPAEFTLANGQVDAGTFVYDLAHQGNDWLLVQRTDGDGDGDGEGEGDGAPIVSPSASAVLGLFSAAPTVWYGETTTLRSRMGELRLSPGASGPWVRAFGGKYNLSVAGGVAYQQHQQGVSFGVDTPLPTHDGQWLVGVMGGYSRSNLDFGAGTDGHVDSYFMGLYSTWLSDTGYYVDALIKANRFQNYSNVRMSDGEHSSGDYDNYGFGGSVEVGKHIALADHWFVEPYAQVSALWVAGKDYGLDNGMQADSDHDNSLLGKVGSHVGRTFNLPDGGVLQPYIKVAAAQEFAKTNRVKINDTYAFNNDLSGSRGELGAGIIAQLSPTLQLHAEFDYSHGEHIEQPWGVSIGARYAW
jgi:outer membrane autotransporter protein